MGDDRDVERHIEAHLMAWDKRYEVHIDDNFVVVAVAMAMRRLTSL